MVRLTQQLHSKRERLIRVEGRLDMEAAVELRGLLGSATSAGSTTLDLSGVESVDSAGRDLLLELRHAGYRLTGASLYIKHILTEDPS